MPSSVAVTGCVPTRSGAARASLLQRRRYLLNPAGAAVLLELESEVGGVGGVLLFLAEGRGRARAADVTQCLRDKGIAARGEQPLHTKSVDNDSARARIRQHVYTLKRKSEALAGLVKTARGYGYILHGSSRTAPHAKLRGTHARYPSSKHA